MMKFSSWVLKTLYTTKIFRIEYYKRIPIQEYQTYPLDVCINIILFNKIIKTITINIKDPMIKDFIYKRQNAAYKSALLKYEHYFNETAKEKFNEKLKTMFE